MLFTSGATGPAKGVVYRARASCEPQLDRLARHLRQQRRTTGWVAAFAPFALYGPALGTAAAVPGHGRHRRRARSPRPRWPTRRRPSTAAVVFASPAALRNVVATADALTPRHREALGRVRLLMSAGAPVPAGLLRRVQALMPNAVLHTPYGMTEVLPVTDITLAEIEAAGPGNGVCVGRPVAGVEVALAPARRRRAGRPAR